MKGILMGCAIYAAGYILWRVTGSPHIEATLGGMASLMLGCYVNTRR